MNRPSVHYGRAVFFCFFAATHRGVWGAKPAHNVGKEWRLLYGTGRDSFAHRGLFAMSFAGGFFWSWSFPVAFVDIVDVSQESSGVSHAEIFLTCASCFLFCNLCW